VPEFALRTFTQDDISAGLRLCRAAGWNQLDRDWRVFLDHHPQGCFAADCEGRVIGSVTTLRYGSLAWISMLLVDPPWRGRGVGRALLARAIEVLSDAACVKLDATPEGRRIYAQYGFQDEFRLWRMEGSGGGEPDASVHGLAEAPHPALDPSLCWQFPNGDWIGGRPGFLATHLGPVIVESSEHATRLVNHARAAQPSGRFFLDVPEAIEWAEAIGFARRRELVRMWRGAFQPTPAGTYAIIGPEFG
jgi:GNAT superfamily N-acetyltransferase